MGDIRLPKCVMLGELVGGRGLRGEGRKNKIVDGWGCLLHDLDVFDINADLWTTAAQDEEKWRRTAEQGAERFYGEMDRCREKPGLDYGMQLFVVYLKRTDSLRVQPLVTR